jgi:hypothetical protein
MANVEPCQVCGLPLKIGDWPCVSTVRPHGRSVQGQVFVPYFDIGLGVEITSLAERKRWMRNLHMDYRDKPTKGELSARADRAHERRKEEARG